MWGYHKTGDRGEKGHGPRAICGWSGMLWARNLADTYVWWADCRGTERGLQKIMSRRIFAMAAIALMAESVGAKYAGAQARTTTIEADEPKKMLLWEHGAPGAMG